MQISGTPLKSVVFMSPNAYRRINPDPAANMLLGKKRISPRMKTNPAI